MLNLPGFDLARSCHAPSRRNRSRGALAELDVLWRRLWQTRSEITGAWHKRLYKFWSHWSGHVISYHALETQA